MTPPAELSQDWCLITDIDGTLIGSSDSTLALRDVVRWERQYLKQHGARLYWVIATGRTLDSTQEVLLESGFRLDEFDALVTCVGAELYLQAENTPHALYHQALDASGFDAERVRELLAPLAFITPQPDHEQRRHKVSYCAQDTPQNRAQILALLEQLPFATRTVFSHDNYLDIVPHNGAKGGAIHYLLQHWQIHNQRAVAAGDSGNDLSMLEREWHGIVVGNGHAALAQLRSNTRVHFAEQRYAAGILDGLVALGFISAPNASR